MGTGSVALITGLTILLAALAASAISSYLYGKKIRGKTVTRGMSGSSGQTVNLSCEAGQVISFTNTNTSNSRAVLTAPGGAGGTCDPYFTSPTGQSVNFFNQVTTMDLLASGAPYGLAACAGQQTCSFTVPAPGDAPLSGTPCLMVVQQPPAVTQPLNFIGTYDCVQT
jgi:hypothetical protein